MNIVEVLLNYKKIHPYSGAIKKRSIVFVLTENTSETYHRLKGDKIAQKDSYEQAQTALKYA